MEGISTKPLRCILLATDLSARCDRALDRAVQLAKAHGAKLVAVCAIEPTLNDVLTARRDPAADRNAAESRLRASLGDAAVEIELVVEKGNAVEVIKKTAQARGCDLIVTGVARGETLGRLLLGTTVEKLAREAEVPVLIVRERPHHEYRDLVAAIDFSEGSRQALQTALTLFPDARPVLCHAYPTAKAHPDAATVAQAKAAADGEVAAFLQTHGATLNRPDLEWKLEHGLPEDVVADYVARHPTELLVLGTHGRTGILRTAIGSVAEQLIQHTPCDVLIVRQQEA
ncbi:Universal stress protein E [Pigmentiphaga humi]|uniref:Universal stress protein E n=1 Tax=Pigmentiphaga humi TaxID=2478468 RepID=A0A3P4B5G4_9BURK|nr:universal stress protein [Pigmentiphaga humi]VCU71141.1 Universal stress protein E [Pigmentiphaga humi]